MQRDNSQTVTLGGEKNNTGVGARRDRWIELWRHMMGDVPWVGNATDVAEVSK